MPTLDSVSQLHLITDRLTDDAADTALSTALLEQVAEGLIPPTLRLFVPGRIVAFGSQDATNSGYASAVAGVRQLGYGAVERLAGGKAAVFHEATLAFAWATPQRDPKQGIEQRFEAIAGIIVQALATLGVEGSIGETPGEYCPGRFSVHAVGRKVMGVGQRLVKGAAHVGGVFVLDSPELVNRPLEVAYERLGYSWNPDATGSVGCTVAEAFDAVEQAFASAGHELTPTAISPAQRSRAADLAHRHRPPIA
jgi:lipoate-protein ligase A